MEVSVEERRWHTVRKPALFSAVGFVALGLIAGLFVYESMKGKGVIVTRSSEAAAAERMTVPPPIDAVKPKAIETATFALG